MISLWHQYIECSFELCNHAFRLDEIGDRVERVQEATRGNDIEYKIVNNRATIEDIHPERDRCLGCFWVHNQGIRF